jgi:hypothetical protein
VAGTEVQRASQRARPGLCCALCAFSPCISSLVLLSFPSASDDAPRPWWQGPKKPPWWTNGKKKWNRGAPLSKFGKGIGRGGKGKKDEEQLETVPLPAEREAVSNDCVRDFLTVPNTSGQENAENVLPAVGLAPLPPIPVPAGLEAS